MRTPILFLVLVSLGRPAFAADAAAEKQAAVNLFTERKNTEAKAAFEKLAITNPNDADVQRYLGLIALRTDDSKQAVQLLERAVALSPASSVYVRDLGDAYGRTAQKANIFTKMSWAGKCRNAYEKAVALDPANVDARWSLMVYYQQAPGIVGGGKDKAYAQASEISKLDASRGRTARAALLVDEKKYAEAFALYEQSLTGGADDYMSLYAIGRLAVASGEKLDRGLEALRKCLTLSPPKEGPGHAFVQWRTGNLLEKKGDKAGARDAYQAALKLQPQFDQAQKALAALK